MSDTSDTSGATARTKTGFGLASRILVLTVAFVMIAEIAIYIPSIANYRNTWLRDRLSAAYTAAMVLEAAPPEAIPENLTQNLLASVGAKSIALKAAETRRLLAVADMPASVVDRFDLRTASAYESIAGAFSTLLRQEPRALLVVGDAPMGGEFIEITIDEAPLRQAMWRYSANILLLSLLISGIVAILGVMALHLLVVRPVRRLTSSLIAFGDGPQDSTRVITPSGSSHEIGRAEEALATMQQRLLSEFRQTKHLAALGLAVAKINHDLRNLLSTAQLLSDRLADSPDALSRGVAPKIISTLDRAIAFCQSTLVYGRAVEPAPRLERFDLHELVTEASDVVAPHGAAVTLVNDAPQGFEIEADREQAFRILVNLLRNAVDALAAAGAQPGREACVRVSAGRAAGRVSIVVSDTGPGVPDHARDSLFEAFRGSTRPGGAGLGLAIAAELVQAHGGAIELLDDHPDGGAAFRIDLPDVKNGQRNGNGHGKAATPAPVSTAAPR